MRTFLRKVRGALGIAAAASVALARRSAPSLRSGSEAIPSQPQRHGNDSLGR